MGEVEAPEARINRTAARDVVGLEVVVFMEEFARVLMGQLQDVVRRQVVDLTVELARYGVIGRRDEIGTRGMKLWSGLAQAPAGVFAHRLGDGGQFVALV